MEEYLNELKKEILDYHAINKDEIENFRIKFISKKSVFNSILEDFKNLAQEDKKKIGKLLNEIKNLAQNKLSEISKSSNQIFRKVEEDLTLPPNFKLGAKHPLTIVAEEFVSIFQRIGFELDEGPEIEDNWHNFTALKVPENHPARDMQDTFFLNEDYVLRTQTSSIQIRKMESSPPPIRTIAVGRVYRNEAVSARSNCIFHQLEALYINKNVSFVDLKKTIFYLVRELFGKDTKLRFRPSFFPFTEPSAEVDISCILCKQKGCRICKYAGWIEIGGTGMVEPSVLDNCKIDKNIYSGFAFGMGLERITMLKFKINDLRLFTENNFKFLHQFKSDFINNLIK